MRLVMTYLRKHLSHALQSTCRMNEGILQHCSVGFCVVRERLRAAQRRTRASEGICAPRVQPSLVY